MDSSTYPRLKTRHPNAQAAAHHKRRHVPSTRLRVEGSRLGVESLDAAGSANPARVCR